MMNTEKEQMLDDVIRRYGFEADETIKFATMLERQYVDSKLGEYYIKGVYKKLMK